MPRQGLTRTEPGRALRTGSNSMRPRASSTAVSFTRRRWPIGTKERVWLDVLLYTGLRRGDAVILGKQHVKNGIATIKTEKSQETGLRIIKNFIAQKVGV